MFGFSSSRSDWKLDAVSILAVLGESNIRIHTQTITLSKFCLLPRLVPAPQAFLRESRPRRLPYNEEMTIYMSRGAGKGEMREGLNYIPNILHRPDRLPPYSVTEAKVCVNIHAPQPTVNNFSLLNILAFFSFLLSAGLLVWSGLVRDGVAFVAVLIMSLASTALGYASSWQLKRSREPPTRVPNVDIIVRSRWGAFLIIHCDEHVARQCYFSSEDCVYLMSNRIARAFGGVVGGLLLTAAVILFANCSWTMQVAIAVTYASLNVMYWLVAAFPEKNYWNLSYYQVETLSYTESQTFTSALSRAIKLTKSTSWVRDFNVAPSNEGWSRWLGMAFDNLDDKDWDAEDALRMALSRVPDSHSHV